MQESLCARNPSLTQLFLQGGAVAGLRATDFHKMNLRVHCNAPVALL